MKIREQQVKKHCQNLLMEATNINYYTSKNQKVRKLNLLKVKEEREVPNFHGMHVDLLR